MCTYLLEVNIAKKNRVTINLHEFSVNENAVYKMIRLPHLHPFSFSHVQTYTSMRKTYTHIRSSFSAKKKAEKQ